MMSEQETIVFEKQDNFQKQTYRNRCYIYGANGKQLLSVPIKHSSAGERQKTKDIRIDHSFSWKKNMIKSLESSYRSSPFFEYYEDEIMQVFEKNHTFLLDLNVHSYELIKDSLQLDQTYSFTKEYLENYQDQIDYRFLVKAKKTPAYALKSYTQVFDDKHGFMENLSILDLLFNEGTNALAYLEAHARIKPDSY